MNAMALLGVVDDRFNLRARQKAIGGFAVAVLLAAIGAACLSRTTPSVRFLSFQIPTTTIFTFPLLLMWYWGIPQAANLIDGINGLSLGFNLLLIGLLGLHSEGSTLLMVGALLAVLLLNFPSGKHFLGDSGALMLGTLGAILTAHRFLPSNANLMLWTMAYPIVDVTMVVAIRAWNGKPLGGADRSHLHHWMTDRLGSHGWLATPILVTLAGLPMLRALSFPGNRVVSFLGAMGLIGLSLAVFRQRTAVPGTSHLPTPRHREAEFIEQPKQS